MPKNLGIVDGSKDIVTKEVVQNYLADLVIPRSSFIIAPSNAVNKTRADLVLAGTGTDAADINTILSELSASRGAGTQAIRVDFLGGDITSEVLIVCPYANFHLYGNGVKIVGAIELDGMVNLSGANIIFDGFSIFTYNIYSSYMLSNAGANCTITRNTIIGDDNYSLGLLNTGNNCTMTGNTSSGVDVGLNNYGTNCIITANTCSGSTNGLSNGGINCLITANICTGNSGGLNNSGTNCTITANICNGGEFGFDINNATISITNKCIIIGNICLLNGIGIVATATCLPATSAAMEDVNTGVVTIT